MSFWIGLGALIVGLVLEVIGAPYSVAFLLIGSGMIAYRLLWLGEL